MACIVPKEVIVQSGTLCTTKEKCIFMMLLKSSWILLAYVTVDCILCYCLKSLYRWIPVQDSGIREEEQQILFGGFLVTALEFTILKRFVLTQYQEVNYLLNASISVVVSFM